MPAAPSTTRRRVLKRAGAMLATATAAGCSEAPASAGRTPSISPAPVPATATATPPALAVVELVDFAFEPGTVETLVVPVGTTVRFVWVTANHNLRVDAAPAASTWTGHRPIEDAGFTHEHVFEARGRYTFHCDPHQSLGMEGALVVK